MSEEKEVKNEAAAPAEEKKEEKVEDKKVEVPAKFAKIVEEIEKMSVLELNELVKIFEEKFGVSATVVAATGPASVEGSSEEKEEKSTFTVELIDAGAQKIAVIKAVKEALALGLKDAKDKVDAAPSVLAENIKKEDAENLKKAVETAGGKIELK
ncbi:MAG: 50S ribosomal protein L7/L12 [Candidatus Zambryskibacteria bacterium]|nr:50S ribosomal protein L7/L12 [Candidatus Zambryskibacteria bacterium]